MKPTPYQSTEIALNPIPVYPSFLLKRGRRDCVFSKWFNAPSSFSCKISKGSEVRSPDENTSNTGRKQNC
jgi:hypothetical protein